MTSILKVTEIQDPTNSNKALEIDSTGRVLTPARPAFYAYLTSTTALTTPSEYDLNALLTTIDFNVGGHFSAAGGFVAPVDGIYFFSAGFYYYNASTGEVKIMKNGSAIQRIPASRLGASRNPLTAHGSAIYQLEANDVIKVAFSSADSASMYGATRTTFFCGHLLG